MSLHESLTNEILTSEMPNKFRLAQAAIQLARHHIAAGQDFTVTMLIDEMKKNPHYINEMEEEKAS